MCVFIYFTHSNARTGGGGEDGAEIFLPGVPLAQNEDAFAVPTLDSPADDMCDAAVGGKVACYCFFREALVPKVRNTHRERCILLS